MWRVTAAAAVMTTVVATVVGLTCCTAAAELSLPSGCAVASSFNVTVGHQQQHEATFWGHIMDTAATFVLKINLTGIGNKFDLTIMTINHSHASISQYSATRNGQLTEAVLGEVCPGWRLFYLQVSRNNSLTLTDDHNTSWVNRRLTSHGIHLQLTMDHFSTSCHTLTPVWSVEGGVETEVALTPQKDALLFTLVSEAPFQPQFMLARTTITLAGNGHTGVMATLTVPDNPDQSHQSVPKASVQLSPDRSYLLHLRVRHTSGPIPHLVAAGVGGTVVEVGDSVSVIRLTNLYKGTFYLLHHLHLQECPVPVLQTKNSVVSPSTVITGDVECVGWWWGGWGRQVTLVGAGGGMAVLLVVVVVAIFYGCLMRKSGGNGAVVRQEAFPVTDRTSQKSEPYLEPRPVPTPRRRPVALALPPCSPSPEHLYEKVNETLVLESEQVWDCSASSSEGESDVTPPRSHWW